MVLESLNFDWFRLCFCFLPYFIRLETDFIFQRGFSAKEKGVHDLPYTIF